MMRQHEATQPKANFIKRYNGIDGIDSNDRGEDR